MDGKPTKIIGALAGAAIAALFNANPAHAKDPMLDVPLATKRAFIAKPTAPAAEAVAPAEKLIKP
jgi:hypothetical protein